MNILLLEPEYKSKYPPLGLMKIAYYHKECRSDFVWFAKGKSPDAVSEKVKAQLKESKYYSARYDIDEFITIAEDVIKNSLWDRVYVTSLFTFEWKKTIETIEYAKTLANDAGKVIIVGIFSSLIPGKIERATGIKPVMGLLTSSHDIGFDDNVNIDVLTPDYSILNLTECRLLDIVFCLRKP